jgi:hypothetical protein
MDVLSSRILLCPSDPAPQPRFYRDLLGPAVCREFGPADDPRGVLPRPGTARGLRAGGRLARALGDDLDAGPGYSRRAHPVGRSLGPIVGSQQQSPGA